MSSTYGLICLNHDPAIEFGDHDSVYEDRPMLAIARNPAGTDWAAAHARCDVLVGRYDPILELACPGTLGMGRDTGCGWHAKPFWADADWLRLLAAAYRVGDAIPAEATEPFASRCWTRERVLRLGPLLGLTGDATPTDGPKRDRPGALRCSSCRKPVGAQPGGGILICRINSDGKSVTCSLCDGVVTSEQMRDELARDGAE